MKEAVVIMAIAVCVSLIVGYYWGLGNGVMEGYNRACNSWTAQEWKQQR